MYVVKVELEVDTGAEVSTMPIAMYQKFSHVPLCPSTVRLHLLYSLELLCYFDSVSLEVLSHHNNYLFEISSGVNIFSFKKASLPNLVKNRDF